MLGSSYCFASVARMENYCNASHHVMWSRITLPQEIRNKNLNKITFFQIFYKGTIFGVVAMSATNENYSSDTAASDATEAGVDAMSEP